MSKKNEFKIMLFIAAFVITFSLGLGAYYIYSRYSIEKPLLAQIDSLPCVEGTRLEKHDDSYTMIITLGRVENIQEEYRNLEDTAGEMLGDKEYEIIIESPENNKFDQIYYEIQPIVYEAMANNQYVWMKDEISVIASQEQLDYKMFIDDNRVYLQFSDGDSYQYHIIDRDGSKQETV